MRFLFRVVACAIVGCNFNDVKPAPTPPICDTATIPQPQGVATTQSTTTVTFALDAIFLGEGVRGSTGVSTTAWKDFGFDLDGRFSTAESRDVCTLAPGAPTAVQADGSCGRDNSFGANIVPIYQSGLSDLTPSQSNTSNIRSGVFSLQVEITGLDLESPLQTNTDLAVQTFAAHAFDSAGNAPSFSSSEDWPVRSDLYSDVAKGDRFDLAYITKGVLVARGGTMTLGLVINGAPLDLTIHAAILEMTIQGDRADTGTLAGVLDTKELVAAVGKVSGQLSHQLCGAGYDLIAQQFRQTSDILRDATNVAGKACDGISIGIGFTARRIANPKRTAPPTKVPPDPCADAGTPVDAAYDTTSE